MASHLYHSSESMFSFIDRINQRKDEYAKLQDIFHQQFSHLMNKKIYHCEACGKGFYGKGIGAHYSHSKQCKQYKDRKARERNPSRQTIRRDSNTEPNHRQEQIRQISQNTLQLLAEENQSAIYYQSEFSNDFFV